MATARSSIKTIATLYVCFYAISYPLVAHFLMDEEGTGGLGSASVQVFQAATLGAFFLVGRFGRGSLRNIVDVWTSSAFYIGGAACCFAALREGGDRWVELSYGARILFWLLAATIFARGSFDLKGLRRIARSFWIGAVLQSFLAVYAYATQHVDSIYRNVYATTGGAYVSGKMIAGFIVLGMLASLYWLQFESRFRPIYLFVFCVGFLVLLFSYNRSAQLSATLAACWALGWLFQTRRMKSAILFVFLLISLGMILGAFGETFLARWQNIRADGGSGREKLFIAAANRLLAPETLSYLFFGNGYCGTKELMYEVCGLRIGTHSDLFDSLLVYGLVGGTFYLFIIQRLFRLKSGIERREPEYFFIRIATIFIVIIGLLTGMFQGTYAFFFLLALCHYWRAAYFERKRRPATDLGRSVPFPQAPPAPLPPRLLVDREPPVFENAPWKEAERTPSETEQDLPRVRLQEGEESVSPPRSEPKTAKDSPKEAGEAGASELKTHPDAAAYLWNLDVFADWTGDDVK